MSPHLLMRPVETGDLPQIEDLHDRAFGPGRFARTAYRIREGLPPFSEHCRAAWFVDRLVAAVRLAPIRIDGRPGPLLLGPLAVEPALKGQGIGRGLVEEAMRPLGAKGVPLVVLVGDLAYYARFGFAVVPPGRLLLPGPVDPARLLAHEVVAGALARFAGPLTADLG